MNRSLILFISFILFICHCINADGIMKKQFLSEFIFHHKNIYYSKTRLNDFTCFEKPMIYENVMTSYWPKKMTDKFMSPYAPSRIPILHIIDMQCPEAWKIIDQANSDGIWSAPNGWLILSKELKDASQAFPFIHLNTQVLIATDASSGGILIQEIYKKSSNLDLEIKYIGEWFSNSSFNWDLIRFNSRMDMSGVTISGTIIFQKLESYSKAHSLEDFKQDSLSKIALNLFEHASQYLKAESHLKLVDTWGYRLPNGTWTGQMGDIVAHKSDVSVTPLFINALRIDYVDYFITPFDTRLVFQFRSPPLSYVSNVYALPFSSGVWLSTFFFTCLVSLMLWLLGKFEVISVEKIKYDAYSVGELFVNAIGIVCQQGSEMPAFSISIRIVFLMMLVAIMFIYTAYSAYIVVLLQSTSTSIQTLKDLLKSRIAIGVHDIPYNRYYFENADEPIRKAIYEKKVASKGEKSWLSIKEGVKKMRKGFFAFHSEESPVFQEMQETWNEDEKCGIQSMKFLSQISIGKAIRKDSPLREVLRISYRILIERGIKSRIVNRYYTKKPQCTGSGTSFVSVGIIDIYPALMTLAYGYTLTIIFFLLELIYFKVRLKLIQNNKLIRKK